MRFFDWDHDPRTSSRPAAVRPIIREAGHMRAPDRVQNDLKKGLTEGVSTYVPRGMTAQPAGEESLTRLLRHRRSRRSRPSARSGHRRDPNGRASRNRIVQGEASEHAVTRPCKTAAWTSTHHAAGDIPLPEDTRRVNGEPFTATIGRSRPRCHSSASQAAGTFRSDEADMALQRSNREPDDRERRV